MVIGWKQIDDSWYYFNEDGTMATDSWIGEDYVDVSGAWKPEILKEKWMSSGGSGGIAIVTEAIQHQIGNGLMESGTILMRRAGW